MAIERLPQSVADAIAAGEVVERPASVVKELCENAVDGSARRLDVVVDGAGTVRIRVVDDGGGIARAELGLALDRHATSKIRTAADLETVATLGFRGEALASIAAVSDLTVCSRIASAPAGGRLRVRHGETVEEGAWGGPVGTSVEVLDLYAATPARLRFLRSDRAEVAAAVAVVSDLVLTRPELIVTCTVDGRTRLRSSGGTLDGALRCVYGPEASELLPVAAEGDINVGGAISQPRRHRGSRGGLVLIVNGRRVHNRPLLAAVDDAYRGLVPAGRHPFGVVSVAIDPTEVDVNVHPTKREVRFRDERVVFAAIQRACWRALREAAVYSSWSAETALVLGETIPAHGWVPDARVGPGLEVGAPPALASPADAADAAAPAETAETGLHPRDAETGDGADRSHDADPPPAEPPSRHSLASLAPLRAAGQQAGRWLLATSPRGIVIVDPHAAHEKVIYADLLDGWSAGAAPQQMLLLAELVECDARALELYAAHEDVLAACGFVVEPFGPSTLRCLAVPAGARATDPGRLLRDVLDALGGGPATEQRHRAAALIACHSAVRMGDELGPEAQQRLLDRLVATTGGVTCPHGRPALTLLDEPLLLRMFRRPSA